MTLPRRGKVKKAFVKVSFINKECAIKATVSLMCCATYLFVLLSVGDMGRDFCLQKVEPWYHKTHYDISLLNMA